MVPDVLHDRLFADLIDRHRPSYAASLTQARKKQSNFRTQMDLWWTENRHNHPGLSASQALAETNILNWLNLTSPSLFKKCRKSVVFDKNVASIFLLYHCMACLHYGL